MVGIRVEDRSKCTKKTDVSAYRYSYRYRQTGEVQNQTDDHIELHTRTCMFLFSEK